MVKRRRLLWQILCLFFFSFLLSGIAKAAGTGEIKITGTVSGKKYSLYKVFDLTYSGSNVSYTIANEWKPFFTTGAGQSFIVTSNPSGNLNQINIDGDVKYINITNSNIQDFAKKAMAEIGKTGITRIDRETATGTELSFTGLDLGYYMVHPEGAAEQKTGQNSLVSLTSTVPKGEVVVKAEYPTITKSLDKASADYGEGVTFTLRAKVPDITGYDSYSYEVTDTLSKGLSFVNPAAGSGVEVTINGASKTVTKGSTGDIHYTTTQSGVETILKIYFDMSKFQADAGKNVVIQYKAKLNRDALIGNAGNPNKVELEYSNDPKDGTKKEKTPPQIVKVYTGKIRVVKHQKGNEAVKLSGAEFLLYKEEGGVKKYYKLNVAPDGSKTVTFEVNQSDGTKLTTNTVGEISFEGIKAGTYFLKELKAPDGYNLLLTDPTVSLTDTAVISMEAESKVANSNGVELPKTGGSGTVLFTVFGGVLMLFAVLSLLRGKVSEKKISKREDEK